MADTVKRRLLYGAIDELARRSESERRCPTRSRRCASRPSPRSSRRAPRVLQLRSTSPSQRVLGRLRESSREALARPQSRRRGKRRFEKVGERGDQSAEASTTLSRASRTRHRVSFVALDTLDSNRLGRRRRRAATTSKSPAAQATFFSLPGGARRHRLERRACGGRSCRALARSSFILSE